MGHRRRTRIEGVRGAAARIHDDRLSVRQRHQPGTRRGQPRTGVPPAVLDPVQRPRPAVQYPQPALVVDARRLGRYLRRHGHRTAPPGQRPRVGLGEHAAAGVQGVHRSGSGEGPQVRAGSGDRGNRAADGERRAVDPAQRTGRPVDRVRGRPLLYDVQGIAGRGHPYLRGHLDRGAVQQRQLTRPGGHQPGRPGQQPGPGRRVSTGGAEEPERTDRRHYGRTHDQ